MKPERDSNNRDTYRLNWWIFGEPRGNYRPALVGLPRYIATVETAKHRVFQFLDASILPDNMLIAIAVDDAFHLGVLSSRLHVVWALAAGGTLEDRPRYNKTRCFETFPFPAVTAAQRTRIRELGEAIDAHRKRQQAQHPDLTLTDMYNVIEKLRQQRRPHSPLCGQGAADTPPEPHRGLCGPLSAKERLTHERGLLAVLLQLHDELDAAVAAAYALPADASDATILTHLCQLNAQRAAEEEILDTLVLMGRARMEGDGYAVK